MLLLHHHDTRIHFLALQALAFVEWKISIPDIQSAKPGLESVMGEKIDVGGICRCLYRTFHSFFFASLSEIDQSNR